MVTNTSYRPITAENIFTIQDEISSATLLALHNKLNLNTGKVVDVQTETSTLIIYTCGLINYLFLAKIFYYRLIYLNKPLKKIPSFRVNGLAGDHYVAPSWDHRDKDYTHISQKAANTTIKLVPTLALPYVVLSGSLNRDKTSFAGYEHSLKLLNKSLALDPNELSALQRRGRLYLKLGYFEQAKNDYLSCLVIDPAIEICQRSVTLATLYQGNTAAALNLFEKGALKEFREDILAFILAYAKQGNKVAVLTHILAILCIDQNLSKLNSAQSQSKILILPRNAQQ